MFNTISWEQYLTVIASLLVLYYLGVLVIYYRKDLAARLSSREANLSSPETDPKYYNPFASNSDSFMGSINPEKDDNKIYIKNKEIGEANKIDVGNFSTGKEHPVDAEPPLPSSETFLLGTVADLLQEIKTLLQLLSENEGTKEDCQTLFKALFSRNHTLKDTSYQDAISLFLYNECLGKLRFELSIAEIKELWN